MKVAASTIVALATSAWLTGVASSANHHMNASCKEIAQAVASGNSDAEVAQNLHVSIALVRACARGRHPQRTRGGAPPGTMHQRISKCPAEDGPDIEFRIGEEPIRTVTRAVMKNS